MRRAIRFFGLTAGIFIIVLMASSVQALVVGPFVQNGDSVTCTPNTEPELVGYYVYWRPLTVPVTEWNNSMRVKIVAGPGVKWSYPMTGFPFTDGIVYEMSATAYDAQDSESDRSNVIRIAVGPVWCSDEFKTRVKSGIDFIMRYNGIWNLEQWREYLEGRMMLKICP